MTNRSAELAYAADSWVNSSRTTALEGIGGTIGAIVGFYGFSHTPTDRFQEVIHWLPDPQFQSHTLLTEATSAPAIPVVSPTPFIHAPKNSRHARVGEFLVLPHFAVDMALCELEDVGRVLKDSLMRASLDPSNAQAQPLTIESLQAVWDNLRNILKMLDAPSRTLPERLSLIGDATLDVPASNAVELADEIRRVLSLTYDDLEATTGIGRTTFLYWRRTGGTPRPATMRKLSRVHALVRAVVAHAGLEGTRAWFSSGTQSPLSLLLAGNLDELENKVHALVFNSSESTRPEPFSVPAFSVEPDFDIRPASPPAPLRRASKPVRKGRLRER